MQTSFGTGRNTVEAINAARRVDRQVFAVDCFRLAGVFAVSAMRTGFLVECYMEERVAREKTQQRSDRADRVTEQASAENRHDNENKQRDGCRDQAGNRHGADRHLEQRVVVYFHQLVGEYVVSPHHDRTEQACRNTPEVAVRVQEQAQSAKAENSHDRRNCQQHVAQPVHRLVIRKTAASFLLFLADAKQTVDDILEYACRTYRGTINASEYQCQQEMEHDQADHPA